MCSLESKNVLDSFERSLRRLNRPEWLEGIEKSSSSLSSTTPAATGMSSSMTNASSTSSRLADNAYGKRPSYSEMKRERSKHNSGSSTGGGSGSANGGSSAPVDRYWKQSFQRSSVSTDLKRQGFLRSRHPHNFSEPNLDSLCRRDRDPAAASSKPYLGWRNSLNDCQQRAPGPAVTPSERLMLSSIPGSGGQRHAGEHERSSSRTESEAE